MEFPHTITKRSYTAPTVIYKLSPTIRSNLFNYKKFVNELDLNKDMDSIPCNCANSPFIDNFHGHIVSGNLKIIPNPELEAIFLKGPQYREPITIDLDAAVEEIKNGIKNLIDIWSVKYSVSSKHFDCWKYTFFDLLDTRIASLTTSLKVKQCNSKFDKISIKNCLKDLHTKYIITPIDKAANNVSFICKRFYAMN